MTRRYRLLLAAIGLAGLMAWFGYRLAIDLRQILGDSVAVGSGVFWFLRLGFPLLPLALALVALLMVIRRRPARLWFLAVFVVLLGPLVLREMPYRLTLLPLYVLSAFYLAAGLLPEVGRMMTRRATQT